MTIRNVVQKDAIEIQLKTNGNEKISHLPFFLTDDGLKDKNFDCAVMSI